MKLYYMKTLTKCRPMVMYLVICCFALPITKTYATLRGLPCNPNTLNKRNMRVTNETDDDITVKFYTTPSMTTAESITNLEPGDSAASQER